MSDTTNAVGFIGLGRMGRGMALNLIKSTGRLHVFDTQPDAMAALTKAGAVPCGSPAELALRCDRIFLCLPSASEVRAVISGADGLVSARRGGLTVIDTSTLDRSDAIAFSEDAAEAGMAYWDCPISGMPFRADNGTLTVMFGGAQEAFEAAKPLLETFGSDIIHSGPIGSGQAMKTINNIIYDVNIAALCEVLPLAIAIGLDPEQLARVVTTGSSRSFASEYFVPRMMKRRFDTDFTLSEAYKDIVNVQRMGIETRASLPVVNAMIGSYQAAIAAGFGDEPKSAMLKVYENALGVQFHRTKQKNN